jgi:hypothetical protein
MGFDGAIPGYLLERRDGLYQNAMKALIFYKRFIVKSISSCDPFSNLLVAEELPWR